MSVIDPEEIELPVLRSLYDYWFSKCRGEELPSRADIDPADIKALLPYVYMIDVERDPIRFRFRLIGTQIVEWFGRNATGLYMDQPEYGPAGEILIPLYRRVVESRQPRYDRHYAPHLDREYRNYGRLILPLAEPSCPVSMILGGGYIQPDTDL